jgi:hypothetical protein
VLRRIFGPKRDGLTGRLRTLHNEELHDLYSSPSVIRIIKSMIMRWAGHVARMGEKRNVYRLLVGKPEGKRPLGRPRRSLVHTIRMDVVEIGWGGFEWIGLAQDRNRCGSDTIEWLHNWWALEWCSALYRLLALKFLEVCVEHLVYRLPTGRSME